MTDRPALLVVDVQRGMIEGFEEDWEAVLPVIVDQIARARQAGAPVVLIQHCGAHAGHPLAPAGPGWALHPDVDAQAQDIRVSKAWSDAFAHTDLQTQLDRRGVTRLVLTGAQTEFCVDATVRRAASLGYDVDLVADGHTTSENGTLTRTQIIGHHNQTLPALACDGPRIRALAGDAIRWPDGLTP